MKKFCSGLLTGIVIALGTAYALGKKTSTEKTSTPEEKGGDKSMDDRFKELHKTIDKSFNSLSNSVDNLIQEVKEKFKGEEKE